MGHSVYLDTSFAGLVEGKGGGAEEAVSGELPIQGLPQIPQDPRHRQDDI